MPGPDKGRATPAGRTVTGPLGHTLQSVHGVKSGSSAMRACGMQPVLAAHLMLQCRSMDVNLILRAGAPPVYNQRRGPKTGINLSKTSTQGLFKGSLAENPLFTRVRDGKGIGHHEKDKLHLTLSAKDPDYQHTVPLPVTMQDILREVGEDGDLMVLGYNAGKLRLGYKEGKGDEDFTGQFLIDLTHGDETPIFYSRPWDRPDNQHDWDPLKKVRQKPSALNLVPDYIYEQVFNQIFTVEYTDNRDASPTPSDIKEAKVFANTPRNAAELLEAIKQSHVLDTPDARLAKLAIVQMNESTPISDILAALSLTQIKAVYDHCCFITTGDWDGLALGHPPAEKLSGFPSDVTRVFNTFKSGPDGISEIEGLVQASCSYFDHLKELHVSEETPLGRLLQTIDDPVTIFSEFCLKRAGCITPHEFLFEQLINYSYRDEKNKVYGERLGTSALQKGMDAGLSKFSELKDITTMTPEERFDICIKLAKTVYLDALQATGKVHTAFQPIIEEHLANHLKIAIEQGGKAYSIPHPHADQNLQDLFQHGFDMRNPYGSNLEGAWFMVTAEGGLLYGETQEQLVQTMLIDDFLERNIIDISHGADMKAGWGQVIETQIKLGQNIPTKTLEKYSEWKKESQTVDTQPPSAVRFKHMKQELQETIGNKDVTEEPTKKLS